MANCPSGTRYWIQDKMAEQASFVYYIMIPQAGDLWRHTDCRTYLDYLRSSKATAMKRKMQNL